MRDAFACLLSVCLIVGFFSCRKDKPEPPVISTSDVTTISFSSAESGGEISSEGSSAVLGRGVCWNTAGSPTTDDSKTIDGSGGGLFVSHISNLNASTLYYVRAYAINGSATAYGNQLSFTTSQVKVPVLTTSIISNMTQTSVVSGGTITPENAGAVSAKGVCWSTSANPGISDNKTNEGTGTGTFMSTLTGLASNTVYYARSYATNSAGTGYGNEYSFVLWLNVPGPDAVDIDGNTYHSVRAGSQIWFVSNLKTTKYGNGDLIGTTLAPQSDITTESNPRYQWAYGGNETNTALYGRLYTWYVIADSRKICPDGWHIPGDADWTTLSNFLGGESVAGGKLKETGNIHWGAPNTGAGNESGFSALPGGNRNMNGTFSLIGTNAGFWSSTENGGAVAWFRFLFYDSGIVSRGYFNKAYGYSVRCVKDS